jgi:aryl-alcohol dehydrogenase-like predicted oxidoreductase
LGVNFFDTAQAYGFGASEQILGRALRDEFSRDRDELVIAIRGGLRQPTI